VTLDPKVHKVLQEEMELLAVVVAEVPMVRKDLQVCLHMNSQKQMDLQDHLQNGLHL
jgi:hypothetical protein